MVSLNNANALNPRQERFVALVASGVPGGRAYEQAGYRSQGNAADVGASKLLRNPKVAGALEDERRAVREASRLTRDEKLGILEEIARKPDAPSRERIAAIKVHNEMTGEGEFVAQVRVSNTWLESIKARAAEIGSGLARTSQAREQATAAGQKGR